MVQVAANNTNYYLINSLTDPLEIKRLFGKRSLSSNFRTSCARALLGDDFDKGALRARYEAGFLNNNE